MEEKATSDLVLLLEYLSKRAHYQELSIKLKRTFFAASPNSLSVIRAVLKSPIPLNNHRINNRKYYGSVIISRISVPCLPPILK
jgi:hypothetical protein